MKNDVLLILKQRYNTCLIRNRNAEEYFKTHTVEECLNKSYKNGTPLDIFNQVVKELSNMIIQIETIMGKNMTTYEKLNGFKLGGE